MVRQLRRLVLGLLLGALVGWLWLRRQQGAETVGETAAPASETDARIVLPTWTTVPPRPEDSPVAGRIVLPEGADNEVAASNGGEGGLGERLVVGGNGAEPTALADAGSEAGTEAATAEPGPTGNGDMTPLAESTVERTETSADADAAAEGTGAAIEGYCVRCKEQRPMVNVHPYTTANKRPALKGECAVCGAGMFKFTKE